jgi:hypothetical protein
VQEPQHRALGARAAYFRLRRLTDLRPVPGILPRAIPTTEFDEVPHASDDESPMTATDNMPPMAVGVDISDPILDLFALKTLFQEAFSPVIFRNNRIVKIHDFWQMLLFRFETLIKLCEDGQPAESADFLPWVLINEALSHKDASIVERLG